VPRVASAPRTAVPLRPPPLRATVAQPPRHARGPFVIRQRSWRHSGTRLASQRLHGTGPVGSTRSTVHRRRRDRWSSCSHRPRAPPGSRRLPTVGRCAHLRFPMGFRSSPGALWVDHSGSTRRERSGRPDGNSPVRPARVPQRPPRILTRRHPSDPSSSPRPGAACSRARSAPTWRGVDRHTPRPSPTHLQ
jgi:hypothetical protein